MSRAAAEIPASVGWQALLARQHSHASRSAHPSCGAWQQKQPKLGRDSQGVCPSVWLASGAASPSPWPKASSQQAFILCANADNLLQICNKHACFHANKIAVRTAQTRPDQTTPVQFRPQHHPCCFVRLGAALQMVAARQALDSLVIETLQRVKDHAGHQKTRSKTLEIALVRVDSGVWLKGTRGQVPCPALSTVSCHKAPSAVTSSAGSASTRAGAWMLHACLALFGVCLKDSSCIQICL